MQQRHGLWDDRVQWWLGPREQGTVASWPGDGVSKSQLWPQGAVTEYNSMSRQWLMKAKCQDTEGGVSSSSNSAWYNGLSKPLSRTWGTAQSSGSFSGSINDEAL